MAVTGFFNTNAVRAYPFIQGTVGLRSGSVVLARLPNETLVDAGFILGEGSGFITGTHKVFLYRITRDGDTFVFYFGCDSPLLVGSYLTFTRDLDEEEYTTEHVSSLETHGVSISAEECDEPLWSGYMVSGKLDALAELLPTDGEIVRESSEAVIEPALIQNLDGTYVKMLALANGDRTRVTAPEDCQPVIWPFQTGVIFVAEKCLQGDILFKPGYNCTLAQESTTNSLVFGASAGSGEGQPCNEIPLGTFDVPPEDSLLLSGGPTCNDVLRSFNGVGGRIAQLLPGRGVLIEPVPDQNKIIIDVSMIGMAICAVDVSAISESV